MVGYECVQYELDRYLVIAREKNIEELINWKDCCLASTRNKEERALECDERAVAARKYAIQLRNLVREMISTIDELEKKQENLHKNPE